MNGMTFGYSANAGTEDKNFGSEFHQLSHDLRNPLNSISGFAELLLMDEGLSPAAADYVRAILSGSQALTDAVVSYLERKEEHGRAAPGNVRLISPEAQPVPRRSTFTHARRSVAPRTFHRSERSGTL